MAKRIIDMNTDELLVLHGRALTESVVTAEGRTVVAEVWADGVMVDGTHNIELAGAFGADIVLLNFVERIWDGNTWSLPVLGRFSSLRELAGHAGRPLAVNLEPGDVPEQRRAIPSNAQRLVDQGVATICLTANPQTNSSYTAIAAATADLRSALGHEVALWSGKMHLAGVVETVSSGNLLKLVEAGADGVLLPLPGTVPGVIREQAAEGVRAVHEAGAIAIGTIGTSQEGSHVNLVPTLALIAKEIGIDAHHMGDAFTAGAMDPELLYAYSVAIRGRRHTWRRMAYNLRACGLAGLRARG